MKKFKYYHKNFYITIEDMLDSLGEDIVLAMELGATENGFFEYGRFKISYEEEDIEKELLDKELSANRYEMKRLDEQFYIDKQGEIIKYKINNIDDIVGYYSVHEALAKQILETLYYTNDYKPFKSAKDCVMALGFIIIGAACGNRSPFSIKEPTQSQLNTMFDLGYSLTEKTFSYVDEYNNCITEYLFKKYH